jgi:hypothetical protein
MGIATHASDLRRWKSFQGQSYQEGNLIERLTSEMDERPRARYELDEEVKTPQAGTIPFSHEMVCITTKKANYSTSTRRSLFKMS